ncbi:MAG: hypothetical protein ACK5CE_24620 [Actinomycetes bacterium]|jgi:hypothetical protein
MDARITDVYVIERFLVGWTSAEVDDLVDRCTRAAAEFARRGVQHLSSIVLPGDETCLSVFTGPDAATVLEANADLGFPVGRIQPGAVRAEGAAS